MLRNDFDKHIVWAQSDRVKKAIDALPESVSEAEGREVASIAQISSYIRSFKRIGATHCSLFTSGTMDQVANLITQAASFLEARAGHVAPTHTSQALAHMEAALVAMAPWPRPYATNIQANQMATLFEDLLARQDQEKRKVQERSGALRQEIDGYADDVKALRQDLSNAETDFHGEADVVTKLVTDQKVRIDEVVTEGLKKVDSLTSANSAAFQTWTSDRTTEWQDQIDSSMEEMNKALDDAAISLTELKSKETEYVNLTSAVAATKMAEHFENEAGEGRKQAHIFFIIGGALVLIAAIPLIAQAIWPANGDPWATFAIRLSIGALLATGATVAVRLGSKTLAEANASKRMELELRTFGPFLANVKDKTDVDNARLELVDRAFGKGYAAASHDLKDEVVTVSAMSELIGALSKMGNR